ncbi:MAG TPA: ABC transporter permease [Streptosporangiaceae bacterium]|jgi:putative ABC transport system permease protein
MLTAMLRDLRAHPGRVAMTLVAIALGVAATVAAWMVGDSAATTLADHAIRTDVSVTVQETNDARLPAALPHRLAGLPGVTAATGVAIGRAGLVGHDGKLVPSPTVPDRAGTNWTGDGTRLRLTAGRPPARPGEVALDADIATTAGMRLGDRTRVIVDGGRSDRPTVVGLFRYRPLGPASSTSTTASPWDTAPTVAYDTATAAHLLRPGYDRVELTAAPGTDRAALAAQARDLAAATACRTAPDPAACRTAGTGTVRVATGDQLDAAARAQVSGDIWDLRLTLLPFAAVALLVGGFVIANTFTMLMTQRTRQIGLLRAVGARTRQVRRAVLAEAGVLALTGGALGALGGVALAPLVVAVNQPDASMTYTGAPMGILLGFVVAVVVTTAAAYGTARRASRIPPMAALRTDAGPARPIRGGRSAIGAVVLLAGIAMVVATARPSGTDLARIVALSGLVVGTLGVLLLTPAVAAVTLGPLARVIGRTGPATRLAVRGAARDVRRTAGTAGAITIGIGLVCAFATVGATFEKLIASTTRSTLPTATTVLQPAAGGQARLTPADLHAAAAVPGARTAAAARDTIITVGHAGDTSVQQVTAIEPRALGTVLTPRPTVGSTDLRHGAVVSQSLMDTLNLRVGDMITLPLDPRAPLRVPVVGAYDATEASASVYVNVALAPPALRRAISDVYVTGSDPAAARAQVAAVFRDRPDVSVTGRDAIIAAQVEQQRAGFVVIYAMFGLAIIVAAFGVVNTLALSVAERTREIGVLRALGATRRVVRRSIRLESVVISLLGAVLGVGVGVAGGAVMQHAMLVQPLGEARVPFGSVGLALAGAVVVAVLAAVWPARRAARTPYSQLNQ